MENRFIFIYQGVLKGDVENVLLDLKAKLSDFAHSYTIIIPNGISDNQLLRMIQIARKENVSDNLILIITQSRLSINHNVSIQVFIGENAKLIYEFYRILKSAMYSKYESFNGLHNDIIKRIQNEFNLNLDKSIIDCKPIFPVMEFNFQWMHK